MAETRSNPPDWDSEIADLCPLARVAFALRCAKRVLSLYDVTGLFRYEPTLADAITIAQAAVHEAPQDWIVRGISDPLENAAKLAGDTNHCWGLSTDDRYEFLPRSVYRCIGHVLKSAWAYLRRADHDTTAAALGTIAETRSVGSEWNIDDLVMSRLKEDLAYLRSASREHQEDQPFPEEFWQTMWPIWPGGTPKPVSGSQAASWEPDQMVQSLPARASIAFATRCAERVLPWAVLNFTEGDVVQKLRELLRLTKIVVYEPPVTTTGLESISNRCRDLLDELGEVLSYIDDRTESAAFDAKHVTESAAAAAIAFLSANYEESRESVVRAIYSTLMVGTQLSFRPHEEYKYFDAPIDTKFRIAQSVESDLSSLQRAVDGYSDTDTIPMDVFGPLWPNGEPAGWPSSPEDSEGCELVLEMSVPEGVSDDEVVQLALDWAEAADSFHRAFGGSGLKVKGVDILCHSPEAVIS